MNHNFKVGDRVCVISSEHKNKCGIVIRKKALNGIGVGVEFTEPFSGGHNCDGSCKNRHGWYFLPRKLEHSIINWKERYEGFKNE